MCFNGMVEQSPIERKSMPAAKLQLPDETEDERIIRWRVEELLRAGYDWPVSMTLAARTDVDLHLATGLLCKGCPPDTALRILL